MALAKTGIVLPQTFLFRSATRAHRAKVIGVVMSGGRDDGSAGLYAIKARGGIAIVQDPAEALTPNMPQNALDMVDIDFACQFARFPTFSLN